MEENSKEYLLKENGERENYVRYLICYNELKSSVKKHSTKVKCSDGSFSHITDIYYRLKPTSKSINIE